MIIIDVNKEKSIETALRTYKSKVQKVKQVQELRMRQVFVKPSVKKRTQKLKAVYIQQKRNGLN
jgi:small subunit ribosomal protein S21